MSRPRTSLFAVCLGIAALVSTPQRSEGQVVIYRLDFEQLEPSVNYRANDGGYYVAPVEGGPGTLLLLDIRPPRQVTRLNNYGSLFYARDGKDEQAVISAAAGSGVASSALYAVGRVARELTVRTVEARQEFMVAEELEGYLLTADSEGDLPGAGPGGQAGAAGASKVKGGLQRGRTEAAIAQGQSVDEAVGELLEMLERGGYTVAGAAAGGGDGGGQGDGTGNGGGITLPGIGALPGGITLPDGFELPEGITLEELEALLRRFQP